MRKRYNWSIVCVTILWYQYKVRWFSFFELYYCHFLLTLFNLLLETNLVWSFQRLTKSKLWFDQLLWYSIKIITLWWKFSSLHMYSLCPRYTDSFLNHSTILWNDHVLISNYTCPYILFLILHDQPYFKHNLGHVTILPLL